MTQEEINKVIHLAKIAFCESCGCGIPRDTCISLGTCNEHDAFARILREKLKEEQPMKGLFIRGINAELRQSLIDCGFEPVKQDIYFNGTMVTSDGKLWHPSAPLKPWDPDGKGWSECKVFNNAIDFLTAAKEMLEEEKK